MRRAARSTFALSVLLSSGTALPPSSVTLDVGGPQLVVRSDLAFAAPFSQADGSGAGAGAQSDSSDNDAKLQGDEKAVPQLPQADPDADVPTLKIGSAMKFDHLGPVIINADGTTRRIDNWDELTEHEKEVTWKRISKRNQQRREVLMEKMKLEEEVKGGEL